MRRLLFLIAAFVFTDAVGQPPLTPDQLYGKLFTDVQTCGIFPDSKTFVDCIPKRPAKEINRYYKASGISCKDTAELRQFVLDHFDLPDTAGYRFSSSFTDLEAHIRQLWQVLRRDKDKAVNGSSLLPLPYPYIVPGGRFREIYYWDSYFTMLGLRESGETKLIEDMINNFSYLMKQFGLIPNGNRSYYLSRSQPPFFSLMVSLLAGIKGDSVYVHYRDELQAELDYWKEPDRTAVIDSFVLYRYSDALSIPRQESYREDLNTVNRAKNEWLEENPFMDVDSLEKNLYRHLRSAAASGWDFSTRWFERGKGLSGIRTRDIAPVDLNMLACHLETAVYRGNGLMHEELREEKISTMKRFFFNDSLGWYCDYDLKTNRTTGIPTLAGMFPLFFGLADEKEVPRIVSFLEDNFLKDGGVITTLEHSGEQWDAPNGWAPLQWITIIGLENYGYAGLAEKIAERWFTLNKKVFLETGKLMEKYNVVDLNTTAGGGEYPSQDGFGWTNGVLLAIMKKYGYH